jgi:ubiquinol-cytochrome c reductase iron-sulfur subunit
MSKKNNKDTSSRRDFLTTVTATVGAVGVGAGVLPIISQMNPDSSVKALASIEVDISNIQEGKEITVLWRGKPVFIKRRTKEEIQKAEQANMKDLMDPQEDKDRVKKSEWLVVVGVCTHLGCVPIGGKGEYNGWFCPCHGSHYDTSGRIRKGPAPTNLEVPKYEFVSNNKIKIG